MPITIHHDLLCTTWRASLLTFGDSFQVAYFSEYTISLFLTLFKSFFHALPQDLAMGVQNTFSIGPDALAYSVFLNSKEVFRYLFLLKSPYLIFDLIFLVAILKFYKKNIWMVLFWAINPFVLYSSYMWGRYEIFPILFCFLSWVVAGKPNIKNYDYLSMFLLGLAISYRVSFILFLPILLIYLSRDWKHSIKLFITAIIPYIFLSKLIILLGGGKSVDEYVELIFRGKIGEGFNSISIFIMGYLAVLYFAIREKLRQTLNYKRTIFFLALSIFTFYASALFLPQYLAWITPAALMLIYYERKMLPLFIALFVVFFFLTDFYFGCYTSVCLLSEAVNPPFANAFFSIKTQFNQKLSDGTMFSIFHSVFIAILFFISLIAKRKLYDNK